MGIGKFARNDRERIGQKIQAFFVMQTAEEKDKLGAGELRVGGAKCAFGRERIEFLQKDAVGNDSSR